MAAMAFPFGSTVYRLRAGLAWDPYSKQMVRKDWKQPEVLAIVGGSVQQTSTSMLRTASREQAIESKSLFCEGLLDVAKGDRILVGEFTPTLPPGSTSIPAGTVFRGAAYTIDGIPPDADTNPFTGWTPPREIPLTRAED